MKNVTLKSLHEDLQIIDDMARKYREAIWENQEGQKAHFDNQNKAVKICMVDIRTALNLASLAMGQLEKLGFEED